MNKLSLLTAALLTGTLAANVMAAQEISEIEAKEKGYQKIASVNTTAETTSPMDAKKVLSQKADEQGGRYFVVIAGRQHGRYSATADVYK